MDDNSEESAAAANGGRKKIGAAAAVLGPFSVGLATYLMGSFAGFRLWLHWRRFGQSEKRRIEDELLREEEKGEKIRI